MGLQDRSCAIALLALVQDRSYQVPKKYLSRSLILIFEPLKFTIRDLYTKLSLYYR